MPEERVGGIAAEVVYDPCCASLVTDDEFWYAVGIDPAMICTEKICRRIGSALLASRVQHLRYFARCLWVLLLYFICAI
jgi:hypothetical protein